MSGHQRRGRVRDPRPGGVRPHLTLRGSGCHGRARGERSRGARCVSADSPSLLILTGLSGGVSDRAARSSLIPRASGMTRIAAGWAPARRACARHRDTRRRCKRWYGVVRRGDVRTVASGIHGRDVGADRGRASRRADGRRRRSCDCRNPDPDPGSWPVADRRTLVLSSRGDRPGRQPLRAAHPRHDSTENLSSAETCASTR